MGRKRLYNCEGWKRIPSDYSDERFYLEGQVSSDPDFYTLISTTKIKQWLTTDKTLLWGKMVPGDQTWSLRRFICMSVISMCVGKRLPEFGRLPELAYSCCLSMRAPMTMPTETQSISKVTRALQQQKQKLWKPSTGGSKISWGSQAKLHWYIPQVDQAQWNGNHLKNIVVDVFYR